MTAIDDRGDAVRASLAERAGDITSVPPDLFERDLLQPPRPPRRPWLVAVAAAAVVLAVVGIVVALRAHGTPSTRPAAPPQCASPSAAAWRAALGRHVLGTPRILAGLADGSFVEQDGDELTMRMPSGRLRNLMVLPAHAQPAIDVDGNQFVMQRPGDANAYVYDSRPVGGSIEMLPDAEAVVIQDHQLYYATTFRGGEVVDFDLTRDTTRVLYRGPDAYGSLDKTPGVDVRWRGGQARKRLAAPLQAELAGLSPDHIFYSGGSYFFPVARNTSRLAAPDGTLSKPIREPHGEHIMGLAGHYVVQRPAVASSIRIVDARTGASLDTGLHGYVNTSGSKIAISARDVHIIDTDRLPELRC